MVTLDCPRTSSSTLIYYDSCSGIRTSSKPIYTPKEALRIKNAIKAREIVIVLAKSFCLYMKNIFYRPIIIVLKVLFSVSGHLPKYVRHTHKSR